MTAQSRDPNELMSLFPAWLKRTVGYGIALLVMAAVVWVVGKVVFTVPLLLYSLVVALLLAALLEPLASTSVKALRRRWLAAAVVELLFLVGLFGSIVLVAGRAVEQLSGVSKAVDRALADIQGWLTGPPLSLSGDRIGELRSSAVDFLQGLVPAPGAGAMMVTEALSGIAIALFVLFFLLKDGPGIWSWALAWSPRSRASLVDDLGRHAWHTLTGYARGMTVVALFDAVVIGLALFVLGVPLALSLTLIVFIGAFVPILGATVSGGLAVAVTMVTVGTWQALVVLGVVLLVQQLEGNVLEPLVMGKAVDLHPVAILAAVTGGALLAGVGGAIIAVPLVAVSYRLLDRLLGPSAITGARDHSRRPPPPPEAR
jgi:predicted PurR-regulated permease PerM